MTARLARVATSALVTGVAGLALAAPADAMMTHDPDLGSIVRADDNTGVSKTETPSPSTTDEDTPWMELGIGALGGLALAGVGIAAASRVRHRQSVTT